MATKTKPVREPWEKYGQRKHATYAGAMDQLLAFERDQHSADALRRANREPHRQPLAALDTGGAEAYALAHCREWALIDTQGVAIAATLDSWGIPLFNEGVLLRMQEPVNHRPRQYLTVREVAELRDLDQSTIRDAIACKNLRASRSGGANRGYYRISLSALRMWLESCGEQPDEVQRIVASAEEMMAREAVA